MKKELELLSIRKRFAECASLELCSDFLIVKKQLSEQLSH